MKKLIFFPVLVVLLFSSCQLKREQEKGKVGFKLALKSEKFDKIIVKGKYSLWNRYERLQKDEHDMIHFSKETTTGEILSVSIPGHYAGLSFYLGIGDSLDIAFENNKLVLKGNSIAVVQNQLLNELKDIRYELSSYTRAYKLYEFKKKRDNNINPPVKVSYNDIYKKVNDRIALYKQDHKNGSESFIRIVELDNKYFRILNQLNMSVYSNKTYTSFTDEEIRLLSTVEEDAKCEEAVLSHYYRHVLRSYIDYLRINDPKKIMSNGKNYIKNEVLLGDYFEPSQIKEYVIANSLYYLMYTEFENDTYYKAINTYGGSWKSWLINTAKEYGKGKTNKDFKEYPEIVGEDINGNRVNLSDFKGKWLFIDFWDTHCGNCIVQFPYIAKLKENIKENNIEFIGVSLDVEKDKENWKNLVKNKGLKGVQIICADRDYIHKQFCFKSIPHFAIINPEGKLVHNKVPKPSTGITEGLLKGLSTEEK